MNCKSLLRKWGISLRPRLRRPLSKLPDACSTSIDARSSATCRLGSLQMQEGNPPQHYHETLQMKEGSRPPRTCVKEVPFDKLSVVPDNYSHVHTTDAFLLFTLDASTNCNFIGIHGKNWTMIRNPQTDQNSYFGTKREKISKRNQNSLAWLPLQSLALFFGANFGR